MAEQERCEARPRSAERHEPVQEVNKNHGEQLTSAVPQANTGWSGEHEDFSVVAASLVNQFVQCLTMEHERVVASLRRDLLEGRREMGIASGSGFEVADPPKIRPVARNDQPNEDEAASPPIDDSLVSSKAKEGGSTEFGAMVAMDLEAFCDECESADAKQLEESVEENSEHEDEVIRPRTVWGWLSNPGNLDVLMGGIIIANTAVIALELEYRGRIFKAENLDACIDCDVRVKVFEDFFIVAEIFFTCIFALELAYRLTANGCRYLWSVSNASDGVVVVVAVIDSILLTTMGSDILGNVAFLRMVRLLRLAKVLRVVRVMKAFESLRVLVGAVTNSIGALGWSMTLLFVLELIGAVLMAQVVKPFLEDHTLDKELRSFMYFRFGTMTNAMFSIFEITMAPGGFMSYRRLYQEVHVCFGIFFVLYVCVVTFAVVRVITAIFLRATLAASATDDSATAHERAKERVDFIMGLKDQIKLNSAGEMYKSGVHKLLQLRHFRRWLKSVNVEASSLHRIFKALDLGAGKVPFGEFAAAIVHMTGSPRATETVMNLYEARSTFMRIRRLDSVLRAMALQGAPSNLVPRHDERKITAESGGYQSQSASATAHDVEITSLVLQSL